MTALQKKLALGPLQRSIIEVEILDGWDEDDGYPIDAIAAQHRLTGRLLVTPETALALADRIGNAIDDSEHEPRLVRAAGDLAYRVRRAFPWDVVRRGGVGAEAAS